MICPKCMVQMHQAARVNENMQPEFMGGGFSEVEDYMTWTVQECDNCGDLYVEMYRTFRLPDELRVEDLEAVRSYIVTLFKTKNK